MNTTISNNNSNVLEIAKQIAYSAQVLAIGLVIPFLFVFGITYKTNGETSLHAPVVKEAASFEPGTTGAHTVTIALSDQNS